MHFLFYFVEDKNRFMQHLCHQIMKSVQPVTSLPACLHSLSPILPKVDTMTLILCLFGEFGCNVVVTNHELVCCLNGLLLRVQLSQGRLGPLEAPHGRHGLVVLSEGRQEPV